MQHTQGDWKVDVWDYSKAKQPHQDIVITNGEFRIAVLDCDETEDNPYIIPKQEAEANARLIAASPELLAVCKLLKLGFSFYASSTVEKQVVERAILAIKATT